MCIYASRDSFLPLPPSLYHSINYTEDDLDDGDFSFLLKNDRIQLKCCLIRHSSRNTRFGESKYSSVSEKDNHVCCNENEVVK